MRLDRTLFRFARRLRGLVHRRDAESTMDAEMQYHIECETADRIRAGIDPVEARRGALRDFGGIDRHKEDARDRRGFRPLDDIVRDARHSFRTLRRNPWFTAAVITTFALGIGATSSIFSLVNGILLRPLPYAKPGELVALWERNAARGVDRNVVSMVSFEAWRDRTRSFAGVAAMVPDPITLDGASPERLRGAQVSPAFFTLLGAHAAIGRAFDQCDGESGGARVVILGDALWRRRYGGDSSIVGRAISIDGQSQTVIGVMGAEFDPPRFGWMTEQPLWLPLVGTDDNRKYGRYLHVIARLGPGITPDAARRDMDAATRQLAAEGPGHEGWTTSVVSLHEQISGDVRTPLLALFAAVALLLLMSAVNVGNFILTFARRRRHEHSVRRAIGASSFRLLRQQLVLSGLLCAFGAVAGIALAWAATKVLVSMMPTDVPRLAEVRVDGMVVLLSACVTIAAAIIFGVIATLRDGAATRSALDLRPATRTTARLDGGRMIAAEVAIGVVLSVLAMLMVRSVDKLRAVDLGFYPPGVVAGRVTLAGPRYATADQQTAFFDALLVRALATPGVASASVATTRPFACCAPATTVIDPLHPGADIASMPTTDVRFVDDGYFTTLRMHVLAGRAFGANETRETEVQAVISRSLARALWGEADPIGRRVSIALFGTTMARVVGVVGDVHLAGPRTPSRPALFLSATRFPSSERDVMVRGEAGASGPNAAALARALRQAVASLDPSVPVYQTTTLDDAVAREMSQDRTTATLLAVFAMLALALAAVGVYGVLAGDVAGRRKEIGIRLALGAAAGPMMTLILRRALVPAVWGVILGVVAALLISRSVTALVFGIATTDLASYAAVSVALLAVALIATLVPAVRAARVSPIEAIRLD